MATPICPPFDAGPEALDQWIQGLRQGGVRQAAPALILALERLRHTELPVRQRLRLLGLLKVPVLKTCTGLPKPWSASRDHPRDRGLSLEQRLYRLMFQCLEQALHQLDRSQFLLDEQQMHRRHWAIRNLFRFFQRQIRYAALWDTSVPANAWRDLHELYAYLRMRRQPLAGEALHGDPAGDTLDPELDYKQLLLFGLAASLSSSAARSGALTQGLPHWARETLLEDPEAMQGSNDVFVVEISEDSPPRRQPGSLDRTFRGWVLIPPPAFRERLAEAIRGGIAQPGARPLNSGRERHLVSAPEDTRANSVAHRTQST
ncbi:MAG: hypothetical protein ACM3ST_09830 [Bdellovibrio bacteriovorus]